MTLTTIAVSTLLIIVGLAALRMARSRRQVWEHIPAKSIYVVDGDSLVIRAGGEKVRIRLYGYDSPEMTQAGGKDARKHLVNLVENEGIWLKTVDVDIYGRLVALGAVREGAIATLMLAEGHAHSDDPSAFWRVLTTLRPRLQGKGIWKGSLLGLRVVHPSVHRRRRRILSRMPR